MAKPRSAAASPARVAARPSRRLAKAVHRRAVAVSEKLKLLREEIGTHADLDKANAAFWEAAKVTCDAELAKSAAAGRGAASSLHSEVAADVRSLVEGKSLEELDAMQRAIAAQVAAGEAKIVEHWQEVAQLVRVEKARKLLARNDSSACDDDANPPFGDDDETGTERELEDPRVAYDAEDEEGSSEPLCPVALPATHSSPTKPGWRKPKYAARAWTGYEWNKYNRAHYDRDHPPPKVVKGYRFVLHYPDLAGAKVLPPQYTVEEDGGGDTCIVRFRAGWPYEDVAFRIVNRDWERSRKAGFRCTFDGGVLHLSFNFKRLFYRR